MYTRAVMRRKLEEVFDRRQARVLSEVITDAYSDLVKTGDFNELKEIVKEIAIAQKRTELRVEELAEAQKRTELRGRRAGRGSERLGRGSEADGAQGRRVGRGSEADGGGTQVSHT